MRKRPVPVVFNLSPSKVSENSKDEVIVWHHTWRNPYLDENIAKNSSLRTWLEEMYPSAVVETMMLFPVSLKACASTALLIVTCWYALWRTWSFSTFAHNGSLK